MFTMDDFIRQQYANWSRLLISGTYEDRFILKDCCKFHCWMWNGGVKHSDGYYSSCIFALIHQAAVLHSTCNPGINNFVSLARTHRHQWGLQYMEGGQAGFYRLRRGLFGRLIPLRRNWTSCCGNVYFVYHELNFFYDLSNGFRCYISENIWLIKKNK